MGHAGVTILFWWTRGEVALEFCETGSKRGEVYASQNPSVTVQKQRTVLFFTAFDSPHLIIVQN